MPSQHSLHSPKAHDRKYKIHATRKAENDYSFVLTDMSGNPPNLVFNKDTDLMKKPDYYLLEFHLHNEPGSDLEFIDDREKVLSACPASQAVNNCAPEGSEFLPVFCIHPTKPLGKKLLYVINTDPFREKFFFGFSFVSKDGKERAYFDPGGENENGGDEPFNWNYAMVGVISGGGAALGTAALLNIALEPPSVLLLGLGGALLGLIVGFVLARFR